MERGALVPVFEILILDYAFISYYPTSQSMSFFFPFPILCASQSLAMLWFLIITWHVFAFRCPLLNNCVDYMLSEFILDFSDLSWWCLCRYTDWEAQVVQVCYTLTFSLTKIACCSSLKKAYLLLKQCRAYVKVESLRGRFDVGFLSLVLFSNIIHNSQEFEV